MLKRKSRRSHNSDVDVAGDLQYYKYQISLLRVWILCIFLSVSVLQKAFFFGYKKA